MTDTPTPTDYGRFWFQARKLVSVIELVIDRRLRRELGMSQTLFLVLSVIEVHPGDFNQQDVADYLATTAATVSRQLDIGARAGYLTVVVSPSSRRENVVALTPSGQEMIEKGDAIVLEETRRVLGQVPPDDFAVAAGVITSMLRAAAPAEPDLQ